MQSTDEALRCFLSIARAIAGPTDYELVLRNFAEELKALIPHDHLDIVLLNPAGTQICYETRLQTGWNHSFDPRRRTENSPIRKVLRGAVPYLLTDDAWTDDRFHFDGADDAPIFEAELHSRIVVPLRVQGVITGSLAISSHRIALYDAERVEIAQGAADLVAAYLFALERGKEARDAAVAESEARGREIALRHGALRLTEGMERERQRLGMDLHDQPLADLSRIKRRVSRWLDDTGPTRDDLAKVDEAIAGCLDDLRNIVEDFRPGVLQMFGIAEAIQAHLDRSTGHFRRQIDCQVRDHTCGRVNQLPETLHTALYRIAQEALNNAMTHGSATRILLDIGEDGDGFILWVDDDGPGFSEEVSSATGLTNIRTRADLISARVAFGPSPALGGARVEVHLPVRPDTSSTLGPKVQ